MDGGTYKFAGDEGFQAEIKRRVNEYFQKSGLPPRDVGAMYLKTAVILLWFFVSYTLLVFVATTWWQGVLLSVSLALAMAGVGFTIQHDANHGGYSNHKALNRIMGMALDMMGASSYLWQWKHNISHHTYVNLSGADEDIDLGPLGRLAPGQPRYFVHRWQQFYLWALYGFLIPKWHFVYDFKNLLLGRIARNRFPRPRGWRLVELMCGKVIFFSWVFVIPMLFHRFWVVLTFYGVTAFILGVVLSVVFQLAHCVEEAEFPQIPAGQDQLPTPWAIHQVQNTVDFARQNRVLTWYLGGLNFQIEHHLFPKICHVHYPRISAIVQTVCKDFGVRFTAYDSFFGAIASHFRWLKRMGQPASALSALPSNI